MLQRAWTRARAWWRAVAAPDGRRPRWLVIAACALVTVMYCTNQDMGGDPHARRGDGVYRPVLARGDGHMMYLMARSTALDGDWRFNNDLGQFGDPWNQRLGADGRKVIPHPIGPPLVWTPLIWIAQLGAIAAAELGADVPLHGYTPWHQRFVFLSSVLFACGAVLLGRRLAQRAVGGAWAPSYAAVAILLGTSLTYYATYMPSYGHALDAFACAGFLAYWAFTLGRGDRGRWIVLGALLGAAALVRVQELAMAIVLVVEAFHDLLGPARRRDAPWLHSLARWLGRAAVVAAIAAVMLVPQLLYWKVVYGDWFAVPQGAKYTRFGSPMMLELLYSARNGWFSTTPIAYAAVLGLFLLPRGSRLLAAGLLATVATQVYLNSTIMDYWGMAGFGQRRLCSVTLPLVVGLAALIARLGRLPVPRRLAHAVLVAALGVFIAWNLMRVGQHRAGRPATSELVPTCCDRMPAPLRATLRAAFDAIGNPFEFPANALFALRHGVPIQRWDTAVGNYPMIPPANALYDGTLWSQRGTWSIGGPGAAPYLIGGWTPPQKSPERVFRTTTTPFATVLVPNLMPYPQRGKLWVAPAGATAVTIRWDGDVIASPTLAPGWQRIELDFPSWSVGEHELSFETNPPGISVGALDLEFAPNNRARYGL
jgi:hypothetical protein